MRGSPTAWFDNFVYGLRSALSRVEILAMFPLLALGAVWWGEAEIIFATSVLLPALLALQALRPPARGTGDAGPRDGKTGLPMRDGFLAALDRAMNSPEAQGRATACLIAEIDEFPDLVARWGSAAGDQILRRSAERLQTSLRRGDFVACIGEGRFAIALEPIANAKLDLVVSVIERLQRALSEPVAIAGSAAHPTLSVGFATPAQADFGTAECVLDAALTALVEARRNGPAGVRGFSDRVKTRSQRRHGLAEEVEDALSSGAIRPWFQPQISTDTGAISGFEALARWHHGDEGVLLPADFLPAVQDTGCMARLGEVVLGQSLAALGVWDEAGFVIPSVSVNFSTEELHDPTLADRVKWEVDRRDLRPARLTIEILETVAAASQDDVVVRNIEQLSSHGFNIDLDDFGTGSAAIGNIARFRVNRIKIDRSFVTRMDRESSQQAVVAGILALAERLGVATVAEGVETEGEQSVLAQLGCDYIQGFGLSRPMPLEDTIGWIRAHQEKIAQTPRIGRRAG